MRVALVFHYSSCLTRLSHFIIYHIESGLNVRCSVLPESSIPLSVLKAPLCLFLFSPLYSRVTRLISPEVFLLQISLLGNVDAGGSLDLLRLVRFLMSRISFGQLGALANRGECPHMPRYPSALSRYGSSCPLAGFPAPT